MMSFTDTASAKKYASIAETAAAQAKLYTNKLEQAPDYAEQAAQSASEAAASAEASEGAIIVVNGLVISASESATDAAASSAEAGNAAAAAVGQCIRVPAGESVSTLPASVDRENTFLCFASDGSVSLMQKGDVAILDADGKIPVSMIPAVAIVEVFVVADQAEMLALDAQVGDVAKRTDLGFSFILSADPASNASNWLQLNDDVLAQLGLSSGATEIGALDDESNPTTVQGALNLKASTENLSTQINGVYSSLSGTGPNKGANLIGGLSTVSFSDLGVKGDGSDETTAFINAANYANLHKIKLTARPDQTFKLTGSSQVTFNYSIDFNGASIDVSSFGGLINFKRPTSKVEYLPGSAVVTAIQTEATLTGQYFSGWLNTDEVNDSLIYIETNIPYYNYLGTDYSRVEINHAIRYGMVSSPLRYSLASSAITKVVVLKNEKNITIVENLNLILGNQSQDNVIIIEHSRFKLKNVTVISQNIQLTSKTVAITCSECFDVELLNVKANWANRTTLSGCYIFSAWKCYDLRFNDCGAEGTGWGAVGTSLCQRTRYDYCNLSRIDSHHPFLERLDVNNCKVGAWGMTVSAIGDLYVNDVEFVFEDLPMNAAQAGVIKSRTDVGGLFAGNIFAKNITVKNYSASLAFLFAHLNTIGGVPAGSPVEYQFCKSINVDGALIESATEINIMPKVQQGSGCKFPSRINYRNVKGSNLIFFEQAFGGLTEPASTVASQVINMPLRGTPNVIISLNDITLSRKGISMVESNSIQKFLFDISIDNLNPQVGEEVFPEVELSIGGVCNMSHFMIEGLDLFYGEFTNKPLRIGLSDGDIRHTATYNTNILNGFNGFHALDMKGVGLYSTTASSLATAMSSRLSGCKSYLNAK